MRMFLFAAAILAASSSGAAQTSCPDMIANEIPASSYWSGARPCGTGLLFNVDGLTVNNPIKNCPFMVVTTPTHHTATPSPGSGTYTERIGPAEEIVITLECRTSWFLFLPIGSRCVEASRNTSATLETLRTLRCPQAPQGEQPPILD